MKNMTLRAMAEACHGRYSGREEDLGREITFVTTDSRKAGPGSLFAAIKGERADGHDFIPSTFEKGALCVISERPPEGLAAGQRAGAALGRDAEGTAQGQGLEEGGTRTGMALGDKEAGFLGNYILVEDTVKALGNLAAYYLSRLRIPVVGITGSVGKTSTKEMVAAILSRKYRTLKTAGNFNNELGLPLTIFRLTEEDEIAVLEMGISHFGEMHELASIARPDTCVITNIGQCHLEFLGDRDGVLRAKSEIFDYLREDGAIILNGEDDKLCGIREVKGIRPVFFGFGKENAVWADRVEPQGISGVSCRIHTEQGSFSVRIPIPGIHMVLNALAGTAVGLRYGLALEEIREGIESLQPVDGRFHTVRTERFTIIDDCYNANPMSMKASLAILSDALGRKVAVLGDMGELGPQERSLHRGVGEYAASLDIDQFFCVGPLSAEIAAGLLALRPDASAETFPNLQTFLKEAPGLLKTGDTVLVKASHFMHFEKIVDLLER